jgi:hypothetical protein
MKTAKNSKKSVSSLILNLICILGTAIGITGCQTHGYQKGDAASASLRTAASEVQAESRALDLTMATLRELVNKSTGDLKLQYERYSKALARLEASAARTDRMAGTVAQKNAAYFEAWNRQLGTMEYPAIRTVSETRKAEVSDRFQAVTRRYNEARAAMQPLISYLNDIRKALATDLTPGGLAAVKPIVNNAETNTVKVQNALAVLTSELKDSSTLLASVTTQDTTPRARK